MIGYFGRCRLKKKIITVQKSVSGERKRVSVGVHRALPACPLTKMRIQRGGTWWVVDNKVANAQPTNHSVTDVRRADGLARSNVTILYQIIKISKIGNGSEIRTHHGVNNTRPISARGSGNRINSAQSLTYIN